MMARCPFPFIILETTFQPLTDNIYHPGLEEFVDKPKAVRQEKQQDDNGDHLVIRFPALHEIPASKISGYQNGHADRGL